jgi:predicted CXXCH cytochrome family protein
MNPRRARLRIWDVIAVIAFACIGAACSRSTPPPPGEAPAGGSGVGTSAGRFVGSEACKSCHEPEFQAWSGSRHRDTLRPWNPGRPLRIAGKTIPPPYRINAKGEAAGLGADGKETAGHVEYVIGGRHREDSLVRFADGRLQVFPIALDADRQQPFEPLRELAGGERPPTDVVDFWTRVGRNADLSCYGCHATGHTLDTTGRNLTGIFLPRSKWVEPGVGCEACHGPGGPHVDAAAHGKPDPSTVKMARGGKLATVDACAACHALREVLPSPFDTSPAHRYGAPLVEAANPVLSMGSNFEFRDPYFADLRPATYQQEAIAFSQSGCALKGGMTCAACHDPHSGGKTAALAAPDGGDGICAPCHANVVAGGAKHTGHRPGTPGGRCLDCHMAAIVRGPGHDPARDHTMAPPVAGPGQIPAACAACHAGARNAGAIAAAWQKMPVGNAAKRRLELSAAIDGGSQEALAHIAADASRGWFIRWAVIMTIAAAPGGPGADDVRATLRSALSDPNPAIRRAAAGALARRGTPQDVDAVQRATDDVDPWTALEAAQTMGALGAPTAGARLLQLMKRPDLIADARAQSAFGHACLVGKDFPRAESALTRALEVNPLNVPAMNELGLSLMGQGKRDEAVTAWHRALDINPRYAAARQNLDAAKAQGSPATK